MKQEIIKVREWIPYIGPLTRVIPLDIPPSSSENITRVLRGSFREGSVYMYVAFLFNFEAEENLERCGDVFFDILTTSKGASALGIF